MVVARTIQLSIVKTWSGCAGRVKLFPICTKVGVKFLIILENQGKILFQPGPWIQASILSHVTDFTWFHRTCPLTLVSTVPRHAIPAIRFLALRVAMTKLPGTVKKTDTLNFNMFCCLWLLFLSFQSFAACRSRLLQRYQNRWVLKTK